MADMMMTTIRAQALRDTRHELRWPGSRMAPQAFSKARLTRIMPGSIVIVEGLRNHQQRVDYLLIEWRNPPTRSVDHTRWTQHSVVSISPATQTDRHSGKHDQARRTGHATATLGPIAKQEKVLNRFSMAALHRFPRSESRRVVKINIVSSKFSAGAAKSTMFAARTTRYSTA